jgi:hypothetical protein
MRRGAVRGAALARHSEFFSLTFLIRRLWRGAHTMHAARMMACKFLPPVENNQSALRASAFLHLAHTTHISCDASAALRGDGLLRKRHSVASVL